MGGGHSLFTAPCPATWPLASARTAPGTAVYSCHTGCHDQVSRTWWLRQQKFAVSQFWKREVPNKGVRGLVPSGTGRENPFRALCLASRSFHLLCPLAAAASARSPLSSSRAVLLVRVSVSKSPLFIRSPSDRV